MFCIEVLSPTCATQFSERQQDIAAKISLSGSLAPKGPGDTRQGNDDYIDGAVAATHLSCRKTNARIVAPVEVEIPAGEPLSAELLGVSLDPGDAEIKLNPKAGNKLPTRRDEKVMVDAGETDKFFKAERKTITVHVVKAKPELHWQAPADIAWTAKDGAKLSAQHLNATAVPPHLTARIEYKPKLGTSLPPGEHKLSARLENSSVSDEAVKTVQVFVRKATPAITWNTPPPQRDAGRGFTLDAKVLNAKTDAPGLEMIYTPPAGTVLGAGSHELQACTKPDKNYRQATPKVTLTVQPAPPGQAADDAEPDDVADPGGDEPADGKPGSSAPGAGKRGGQRGGGKPGSGKSGGGTNKGQRKKT